MLYELLQDHPPVFRVDSKLLQDRLDAVFFKPEYAKFDAAISGLDYDVCEIGSRKATTLFTHMPGFSKDKWVEYVTEGIPYLLQINVQESYVEPDGWQHITPLAHSNLKTSSLQPGDVLLTATGMHYGKAAVVPEWLNTANACPDIFRLVLRDWIDPYYITAYLNCEYGQIELRRYGSGANRPRIITEYARKVRLVIPPRSVQEYIGAKVRLAERCRVRAGEVQEEANCYLDDLLGLPKLPSSFEHSANWWVMPYAFDTIRAEPAYYLPIYLTAVQRLEEIGSSPLGNGLLVGGKYGASVPADYKLEGIPFIRGTDLSANRIDISDLRYLTAELAPKVRTARVRQGDVLITRSGTVGITAAISDRQAGFAFGSFMIRLRFSREINPFYAAAFLNSPYGRLQSERQSNGAVQLNINLEEINRILMPVPALKDQSVIAKHWQDYNFVLDKSVEFIHEAEADVEALIEGRLDVEGILAGRIQPPTWEDIEV